MNVVLRPDTINIISLCTGGAGLDLGIELAMPDARVVCMVEREAFLAGHLVSAMENGLLAPAPIWSDARTFDGRAWRGAVDGLIGGIPCQPHSVAGKRLGQEDERDLWSDARRIIVQSGAWFVLIENVPGMLTSGGADRVRRDLHRMGFEVEGGLFRASEVGASHERERIFILAVADARFFEWIVGSGHGEAGYGKTKLKSSDGNRPLADGDGDGERSSIDLRGKQHSQSEFEATQRSGRTLVHAECSEWRKKDRDRGDADRHDAGRTKATSRARKSSRAVDDASRATGGVYPRPRKSRQEETDNGGSGDWLFPPCPNDIGGWRGVLDQRPELKPAFRRVADGMAAGMDIAQSWSRVDRLRMLGNGVVSLEAAYAYRTLVTRLAARGSAGAGFLVRAMGDLTP